MIEDIFDKEPIGINDDGVKWYMDEETTKYARRIGLPSTVNVLGVDKNGERARVIVNGTHIEFYSQSLEAIGVHLDMMKLAMI